MLWRKAWRESRARFLIGAATLGGSCLLLLQRDLSRLHLHFELPQPYTAIVWSAIYSPRMEVVFVLLCLVLGLGGLHRERAAGTAAFTLALPVSRMAVLGTRAGVGVLEVAALAFLPALLVPAVSPLLAQQSYPVALAATFGLLFLPWGLVWFAASLLWSTLLKNDYSAMLASLLTPFAFTAVYVNLPAPLRSRFPSGDFFEFMSGASQVEAKTYLFTGQLPLPAVAGWAAVAMAVILSAAVVTSRQDF